MLREFRVGTPLPGGQPKNPAGGSVCAAGMRKRVSLDKNCPAVPMAKRWQAPPRLTNRRRRFFEPAPRTAPPGWHTRSCCPFPQAHGIACVKKKSPASRRGPRIHFNPNYLLAEAVDQAALDAQVILLCAAKVRVEILELDRAEGQVRGNREVRAAAERHRKRIR